MINVTSHFLSGESAVTSALPCYNTWPVGDVPMNVNIMDDKGLGQANLTWHKV